MYIYSPSAIFMIFIFPRGLFAPSSYWRYLDKYIFFSICRVRSSICMKNLVSPYGGSSPNLSRVHDSKIESHLTIRIIYINQGRTIMTMVSLSF